MAKIIKLFQYIPIIWEVFKLIFATIKRVREAKKNKVKKEESMNEGEINIKELADKVMAESVEFKELVSAIMSEIKSTKSIVAKASCLIKHIPDVVIKVEVISKDIKGLSGENKKALAVEILNRMIDIPLMPELGEGVLIGFAIDAIVAAFNKYGKDWVNKL